MFEPHSGSKLAAHYLALVQIASLMSWLRSFGDTAGGREAAAHVHPSVSLTDTG